MNTAVPWTRAGFRRFDVLKEQIHRAASCPLRICDRAIRAALPGRHQREDDDRHGNRDPPAAFDLDQVGAQEGEIDDQKSDAERGDLPTATISTGLAPRGRTGSS